MPWRNFHTTLLQVWTSDGPGVGEMGTALVEAQGKEQFPLPVTGRHSRKLIGGSGGAAYHRLLRFGCQNCPLHHLGLPKDLITLQKNAHCTKYVESKKNI